MAAIYRGVRGQSLWRGGRRIRTLPSQRGDWGESGARSSNGGPCDLGAWPFLGR
uniref:Uncharacterized protein n=1 Tax=Arundo donax TaxID=35708 RepID=A0A0A9EBL0_ARUDO